jgi:V8-like Glu-specific endopeptidase
MNRSLRRVCAFAIVAWASGCTAPLQGEPDADFEGGAAGNPANEFGEAEASADFEEAETLEQLMAREPMALGVELPEDLVIEKKIVGGDSRVRVADTRARPHSTIATLIVQFPDAPKPGLCTGSLIASDALLTAAHCVYNAKFGGWARSMRVVPGAFPSLAGVTQQPFGSASGKRGFVPEAYRAAKTFWAREPYDYAVVRIGHGLLGAPGVRAFAALASPTLGRAITLTGYHGDKCAGGGRCVPGSSSFVMHTSKDSIRELLPTDAARFTLFNHYADSNGGASGSPIVSDGDYANTIFAVHVAGFHDINAASWNMGILLTPTSVTNIKSWMTHEL